MFDIMMINGKGFLAVCWTSWVGFIAWLLGGFDLLVQALALLMVLDYVTGVMGGFKEKRLNSKRANKGILKKILIWLMVACATIFSYVTKNDWIRNVTCIFYVATEILSIVENVAKLGVPIPKKLKKALEQCVGEDDDR